LKTLPSDAGAVKAALDKIDDAVTSATAPAIETASANPVIEPAVKAPEPKIAAPAEPAVKAEVPAADPAKSAETPAAPAVPAATQTPAPAASAQTAPAPAQDAAKPVEEAAVTGDEPKLIQQAPLQHSDTSVIIRRGDTLWQISRRVYGQGVRYTTIYLANKEQINDPDRILPGQIFGLPDKPLNNAEEIHRKRLGLQ